MGCQVCNFVAVKFKKYSRMVWLSGGNHVRTCLPGLGVSYCSSQNAVLQHTMPIVVYFSSATGSREIKQQQSEIFQFLDGKNIKYFAKDITVSPELKEEMRKKVKNQTALPPQVFNGDKYCGNYEAFFNAVEDGKPEKFFGL